MQKWAENGASGKDKEKYLPAFIPSSLLTKYVARDLWNGKETLTGLVCYDVDDISVEYAEAIIEALHIEWDLAYSFLSPRGGVKFGLMTDIGKNEFGRFKLVWEHFEKKFNEMLKLFGAKCDIQPKAFNNQCYVSYDPNAYYNAKSKIYETGHIKEPVFEVVKSPPVMTDDNWLNKVSFGIIQNESNMDQTSRLVFVTCAKRLGWSLPEIEQVDRCIRKGDTNTTTSRLYKQANINRFDRDTSIEILEKRAKIKKNLTKDINDLVKHIRILNEESKKHRRKDKTSGEEKG